VTKWVDCFTDPAEALEGENCGVVIVGLIG